MCSSGGLVALSIDYLADACLATFAASNTGNTDKVKIIIYRSFFRPWPFRQVAFSILPSLEELATFFVQFSLEPCSSISFHVVERYGLKVIADITCLTNEWTVIVHEIDKKLVKSQESGSIGNRKSERKSSSRISSFSRR